MGTDIHIIAEVWKDGRWQRSPASVPADRAGIMDISYNILLSDELMGKEPIAVVRNGKVDHLLYDGKLRGYPTDMDTIPRTRPRSVFLGFYSHNHVTLAELLEYRRRYSPTREEAPLFHNIVEALIPLGDPEDVRVIYGFD